MRARWTARLLERLESRVLMSGDILQYHVDAGSTGLNNGETVLTPTNVVTATFGKKTTKTVTGQVYAEPLYRSNVNITTGANQGIHNIVLVATEHNQVYAFDSQDGTQLWTDNLLA